MTLTRIKNEARSNIQLSLSELSLICWVKQICDHGLIGHCKFQVQLTPCFSFHSSYTELVWFYIWRRNRDPCTVFREDPVLSSNNLIKYPSTSAHIGWYPLAVLCFWSYFRSGGWRHSPFLFLNVSIAYWDAQMIHWNRIWALIRQNVRNAWCETQGG